MSTLASTVSSQFQTTLPKAVRTRLRLSKNDRAVFRSTESAVLLEKADAIADQFAAFHRSITGKVKAVPPGLTATQARELAETMDSPRN